MAVNSVRSSRPSKMISLTPAQMASAVLTDAGKGLSLRSKTNTGQLGLVAVAAPDGH